LWAGDPLEQKAIEDHFDVNYELEAELELRVARKSCWKFCANIQRRLA